MFTLSRKLPGTMTIASAVWFGSPAVSFAAADDGGPTFQEQSGVWMIFQVIVILALVIGLFYVTVRVLANRNKMASSGKSIRSLGGVPLGPNKSIQVVEIGNCLYVVGVGDNIGLLEKIANPEEVAYLTELLTQRTTLPQFASLGDWLQRKLKKEQPAAYEEDITQSYQQVFYNKMQKSANRKKRFEDILQEKQSDRLNDE